MRDDPLRKITDYHRAPMLEKLPAITGSESEDEIIAALMRYSMFVYYELSGTSIFYTFSAWTHRFSKKFLKGVRDCAKKLGLSEAELRELLFPSMSMINIPFHFFTVDECLDILFMEMGGETKATAMICQRAEKRFSKEHPIIYRQALKERKSRCTGFVALY